VPRPSSPVGAQSPGRTLVTVNCLAWWAGLLRGWVSAVPGALSSGRIRPVSLLRPRGGLLRGGGCPQFRRSPVPRAKRLGFAASPTEWAPQGEAFGRRGFAHGVGSYAGGCPQFRRSPVLRAKRLGVAASPTEWAPPQFRGWVSAVPYPQFRRSPVLRAKRLGVAASPTEWAPAGVGVRGSVPCPQGEAFGRRGFAHGWVPTAGGCPQFRRSPVPRVGVPRSGLLRGWVSAVPYPQFRRSPVLRAKRLGVVRPRGGLLRGGGCPQFRRSPVPRAKRLGFAASPTEWAPTGRAGAGGPR
jgi:hypothetical protein